MSAPATPRNWYVQTANLQNYLLCSQVGSATSYKFYKSTDNVTFTLLTTAAVPYYTDTAVTGGTQYWYKVAAHNTDGDSSFTLAQSAIPTETGEMSLAQARLYAQQRADRVNSNFITLPEWNLYINQSMMELYDLLITVYEDYNIAPGAVFYSDGSTQLFTLPNGVTSFYDRMTGSSFVAAPFYKLRGVDLGVNTGPNGWVTMKKFTFNDRNKYFYPNSASTIYGVFNAQYRLMGNKIMFIPVPSSGQPICLWYIPRLPYLLAETDTTSVSISGWIEYVIVDAAIKALAKEESDTSVLMVQKAELKQRIEASAANRDAAEPEYIQDSRNNGPWGFQGPTSGGFGGGF